MARASATKKPSEQFEQLIRIDEKQKSMGESFARHEERDERRFGDMLAAQGALTLQYNALDKKFDHFSTQLWTAVAVLSAVIPIIFKIIDVFSKNIT